MSTKKADVILKAIEVGIAIACLYPLSPPAAIAIVPISIYCLIVIARENPRPSSN